jgi:phosphoenolpyruvate-protein kinase (PTS system EI component)
LAGLVLETGGTLAHGASLCREFGLPCVTAVDGATERINDGDLIFIRGGDGIVEILERAHPVHAAEQ